MAEISPVPRERRQENRGGYDCKFVEPPPSVLQTECPVCLKILKGPCLISCTCGYKFCRECIEPIKKDGKPCPLCNEPDFTFMREHALERSLKDLEVWCSYRKEGCEWKGKLGKLEEHLNRDPSSENQLNGCQLVAVECMHKCGAWFQRRHITTHETQQCKMRPYSCDHCRDYHSTFEDVTEVHYPQCGKYPVACPNDCDVYKFERQKLENHLREQCPLTIFDCPFHFVGCEIRLPRKDIPEHTKEMSTHFTLLATATQKLVKENQELRHEVGALKQKLSAENQRIKKENQELRHEVGALKQKLSAKNQRVMKENQELRHEVGALKQKQFAENQRVMKENQELQQNMKELNLQLVKEKQELQNMEEFINLRLVIENQELRQNMKKLLQKQQVIENEAGSLKEGLKKQSLEVQQLACHPGFPVDYHVKQTDEEVYSPPFYTHPHGYRMCVRVHPNGYGSGEGTHVSIFTHMMQGPFDDYLKWPFRREITIQIVNQVGDHDHVERIIDYNDKTSDETAGRVNGKERPMFHTFLAPYGVHHRMYHNERAQRWGYHTFLAHDELQYNARRKTQYFKDNTLHIRVMKVTLS